MSPLWVLLGVVATTGTPPTYPDPERFADAIAAFEREDVANPPAPGGIVFVGSSSIVGWDLQRWFPDLPARNRGFGGSLAHDALHFFDRLVPPAQPGTVVFYEGDNDLAQGLSPDQVLADVQAFVRRVHAVLPRTRVVLLSVKPSPARRHLWPKAQATNARLTTLAEVTERVDYVDLAGVLLDAAGEPRPELYRDDALHLNEAGYALWTERLRPHLTGERPAR